MNQFCADNLHVWKGDTHVLRGVSFTLECGTCLQVTGANGAGKTTLLRALSGLIPLEAGAVRWCGLGIEADPAAYHRALAYLAHDNGLKGDLSAEENLRYGVGLRCRVTRESVGEALTRVGLAAQRALPLRQLSAGQRRRVALARLPLLEAPLWLLDEPGANLDTAGQALVHELLQSHVQGGGLAVVATHQRLELAAGVQSVMLQ